MVTFQDVVIPPENVLGKPGEGFKSRLRSPASANEQLL
jgi:alkylation response protein AidB-like acyl-CoA dehydrogenase